MPFEITTITPEFFKMLNAVFGLSMLMFTMIGVEYFVYELHKLIKGDK